MDKDKQPSVEPSEVIEPANENIQSEVIEVDAQSPAPLSEKIEQVESLEVVDVEREDNATTLVEQTADDGVVVVPEPTQEPSAVASALPVKKQSNRKVRILLIVLASVILVGVAAVVVWQMLKPEPAKEQQAVSTPTAKRAMLGVAVTAIDGEVTYRHNSADWQTLGENTQLVTGDTIRTGAGSRVVLTLDDGSAVRLDADTTVALKSLVADDVKIDHLSGSVYSRVVPSQRKYTVTVDKATYQALGTAFVTVNKPDDSGVRVFESSVKTNETAEPIEEGKQYYHAHTNAQLKGKVTTIDVDGLVGNEFVAWNLSEDEKDAKFKDKLGLLDDVKQKTKQKADEQLQQAEAARQKAAQEAAQKATQKAAQEKKKAEEPKHNAQKVIRGQMSLSYANDRLVWNYTGQATHGYKVVYSTKHSEPMFGRDEAIYFGDRNVKSTGLPKEFKSHATYYVRVCAYTADTEEDKCVNYSNAVAVKVRG